MKIVHIITRLILGGAQENTLITCREQAKAGHDVTLITGPAIGPEGGLFKRTKDAGFETIVVKKMVREIKPIWDIKCYREIKKLLEELKPDVVHTHSAKAGIIGRLAAHSLKWKWEDGKPAVVHTIHGLAFHEYQSEWLNKLYVAIEKYTAKKTDAIISVADTMTEKALAAGVGEADMFSTAYSAIDEEDFLTVPDGDDIKRFRQKYGINDKSTVLVTIARLAELKGHEYIIESAHELAKRHRECNWLFVGDGALKEEIVRLIRVNGLGYNVKFTGLLDPSEIPMAIHASDILVHCSLREGLARVLPQAMLCGKPVVSFDIDGAKEVVNENTGRLIEPGDIEALTAACEEFITDPALRERIGQNGREMVTEQFSPQHMVKDIHKAYERALEREQTESTPE